MFKRVKLALQRIRQRIHPLVWVVMLLVACLEIPIAVAFTMELPSRWDTVNMGLNLAKQDPVAGLVFTLWLLFMSTLLMFFPNAAFVLTHQLAGYEPVTLWQWVVRCVSARVRGRR